MSRDYGPEISTRNTKVMVTSEGTERQAESFRYLGAVIIYAGNCSIEIRWKDRD